MGFKNISLPNTEADDLMGCYAIAAKRAGHEVILATNDKDLFQLVNDKVKVYTTAKATSRRRRTPMRCSASRK
jgi:DNA polymerase-1